MMKSHQLEATIAGRTARLARAAAVCIPLLVAQGKGQAATAAPVVALEYSAASSCPEEDDFKAVVTSRLGYDAFREDAPDRVSVRIEARGRAFEGRIEWRNAEGKWVGDRTFPSRTDDCGGLARAMAFALALQVQFSALRSAPPEPSAVAPVEAGRKAEAPDGAAEPPSPTPPSNGVLPSAPGESASPPAPPVTTPVPSERPDTPAAAESAEPAQRGPGPVLAVGAGASIGFGLASSVVPFGRVVGSLAWPHWSLELSAEAGWPTTTRRDDGAGFSQQQLLGSLGGCGILDRVSACLLAKGGAVRVAGKDVDSPATEWGSVFEVGLRLAVTQGLGRHAYLAARAEGLVNVMRWNVTLDKTLVWTSPRFAETLGLDVGVRFP
jgi:hypothetical protein